MNEVVRAHEKMVWHSPAPYDRTMGLFFARDMTPTKSMSAGNVVLQPGQEQTKLSVHEGEEIYFVVSGTGQFVLNDTVHDVERGSAVYIAPGTRHRAINKGDEPMELMWVNSPPVFTDVPQVEQMLEGWERVQ